MGLEDIKIKLRTNGYTQSEFNKLFGNYVVIVGIYFVCKPSIFLKNCIYMRGERGMKAGCFELPK